ncbi:MAG: cell wall hydrolase [Sphingomicrobium sp.]
MDSSNQQVVRLPPTMAPPLLLRDLDRQDALGINATIPFSSEPNPAAQPFKIRGDDAAYNRALHCLTEAIYYEAASELPDGQRAVAQVVLNRVRHPAFSHSVCAAVYHGSLRTTGCQFSFTCDGSMRRKPTASGWVRAREIAEQALAGAVYKPVGYATHYHADYVVPYWATHLAKSAVVGTHIFYRWLGWWGQPPAFANQHSGKEMDPRLLRNAALRRHGVRPEKPSWSSEDLVLAADPRIELISIIHLLAVGAVPSADAKPYEKLVHEHFGSYSNHVAVEIYRQLSEGNSQFTVQTATRTLMQYSQVPELENRKGLERELVRAAGGKRKLEGFISAARDFVTHTNFDVFFKKRKPLYAELEARAREPAFKLVSGLELDSGAPFHRVQFILAPLLAESGVAACNAVRSRTPDAWVIVGLGNYSKPPFGSIDLKDSLEDLAESECLNSSGPKIASPRSAAHAQASS